MDELLQLQIKNLEFLINEAVRLNKDPKRVFEIWKESYEEDKKSRGSSLYYVSHAEAYLELLKSRMDYQVLKVQLYLYHNEMPSLS